jgi:uncharacterized RDD family membrane protein YckC
MLAGWWHRVGATLVDGVILFIVEAIIGGIAVGSGSGAAQSGELTLVGLGIGVVYQTLFIGWRGQTIGNMALRTRVVDAKSGGPVGYGRSALHYLVEYVLFVAFILPVVIDILWPLWDGRSQTLHDKAVGTVVVRSAPSYYRTPY